jgi:hypothetical protein
MQVKSRDVLAVNDLRRLLPVEFAGQDLMHAGIPLLRAARTSAFRSRHYCHSPAPACLPADCYRIDPLFSQ